VGTAGRFVDEEMDRMLGSGTAGKKELHSTIYDCLLKSDTRMLAGAKLGKKQTEICRGS